LRLEDRMDEPDQRIRGWWPAAAVLVLVGVVVLSLGPDVNPSSQLMDRLGHSAAYALLTAVVLLARDRRGPRRRPSTIVLACCLVAFGTAMELAQATVHRDATVVDGLADAVGVASGVAVYRFVRAVRDQRRYNSEIGT
jgi:VanZ family protein